MAFLTPQQAADLSGFKFGYLSYLRTAKAKELGHVGPPWYTMEDTKNFGIMNPTRIRYLQKDVEEWAENKARLKAERLAARPKLTRHSQG